MEDWVTSDSTTRKSFHIAEKGQRGISWPPHTVEVSTEVFLQGTNHLSPPERSSSDLGFVCDLFEASHSQNLLGIPLPSCPGKLEGRAVKPG